MRAKLLHCLVSLQLAGTYAVVLLSRRMAAHTQQCNVPTTVTGAHKSGRVTNNSCTRTISSMYYSRSSTPHYYVFHRICAMCRCVWLCLQLRIMLLYAALSCSYCYADILCYTEIEIQSVIWRVCCLFQEPQTIHNMYTYHAT